LRSKLKLEERELDTTDEIIIIKRQQALLGLVVDEVESVSQVKNIPAIAGAAQLSHLRGALKLNDEIVLVHDIDAFLSDKEEMDLATALARSVVE
jgi:purine-binding chemotaxis protein CheW